MIISLPNLASFIIIVFLPVLSLADSNTEIRCGWFENPSPNNAVLNDKDGEWTISLQGEHEAVGTWPRFKKLEWVNTGVASYGYGCACMKVIVNKESMEIDKIIETHAKPLSVCRRDKTIKEPSN